MSLPPAAPAAPASERTARALANARNRALDALFIGAQHGGSAWAADLVSFGSTCRAARGEEALWSGLARAHNGARKRTVLMHASDGGDVARVSWLLARGTPRDVCDGGGWTALYYASDRGHADVVRALVAGGASVDVADDDGWTPLMRASCSGKLDAVLTLLATGAKVNATFSTAFRELLTPLHWACRFGHEAVARALLAAGANVNAQDSAGWTPLHHASLYNHPATAAALLAAGADRAMLNDAGRTARYYAMTDAMRVVLDA